MMPSLDGFAVTRRLRIETLTPVHVGAAEGRVSPLEYLQDDDFVYLISVHRLLRLLKEEGLLEDYLQYVMVSETASPVSLDGYLAQKRRPNLRDAILRDYTLRKLSKGSAFRLTGSLRTMTTAALIGQGGRVVQMPYLPGTSLKGAMRTAVLYRMLEHEALDRALIMQAVTEAVKKAQDLKTTEDRNAKKRLFREIHDIVTSVSNRVDGLVRSKPESPNTDWLRGIHIGDAWIEEANPDGITHVEEVRIASLNDPRQGGGYHFSSARIWAEVLPAGTVLTATLAITPHVWRGLQSFADRSPRLDLAAWLSDAEAKTERLLEEEIEFFNLAGLPAVAGRLEKLRMKKPTLRLGWGSGLLSTTPTVLHLSVEERRGLRELPRFLKRRHDRFPQSRKVVVRHDVPLYTLGWMKISIEGGKRP